MVAVISNRPEKLIFCFQPSDIRNSLIPEDFSNVFLREKSIKRKKKKRKKIFVIPYGAISGYLSKTVWMLYRNFQYKYAETYKAVLFHEGKGVSKGSLKLMVIQLPWLCAGSLCSPQPFLLQCENSYLSFCPDSSQGFAFHLQPS